MKWCIVAVILLVLMSDVEGWRRRRRRRRACAPTNCALSSWSQWNACSQPCGTDGTQRRTRTVTRAASCGGSCPYHLTETRVCNRGCLGPGTPIGQGLCSCTPGYSGRCCTGIDGGWSDWTAWTECTKSCGNGSQQRVRNCTQPPPINNGKPCQGSPVETRECYMGNCPPPVDGGYGKWGKWGACSTTCNPGVRQRKRECSKPYPMHGGKDCTSLGPDTQTKACNRRRKHRCKLPVDGGYGAWLRWGACSTTCNPGVRQRKRECIKPYPQYGGKGCAGLGPDTETKLCNTKKNQICKPCSDPVDGGYNKWTRWQACSTTCNSGVQLRTRECTNPYPKCGGKNCTLLGPDTETRSCNTSKRKQCK